MRGMRVEYVLLGAALLLVTACGEEERPLTPSARPMAAAQPSDGLGNMPPEIRSVTFRPPRPASGEPLKAVVDVEDPEGDSLELGFSWTVNGEVAAGGGPTFAAVGAEKGDVISVRVVASDGFSESQPYELSTNVSNRAPRLKSLQVEPAGNITAGGEIVVTPLAEDPDGDPLRFEYAWWVNDDAVDETGPTLSTKRLRRGDSVRVRVVANDGDARSDPIRSDPIEVVNAAPLITSTPTPTGSDGVFRYDVEASDADGDRNLRFKLAKGPDGMSVDAITGLVEWTSRPDQAGTFPVEVVVRDLQGGQGNQTFELTVGVDAGDAPPASPGS